jgi:hypothetical protein
MFETVWTMPALTAFGLFVAIGFFAQLIDGAVGMAYGTLSSAFLLSLGVPPAAASAAIHAAECVTTGASGISHLSHKNIDPNLFWRLAPAGALGGALGVYVLTGLDEVLLKSVIVVYLAAIGVLILTRAIIGIAARKASLARVMPLGVVGGFLDASGGGGWGPVVTSTLIGSGHAPRMVIGSVSASEFFVTVTITGAFVWALASGRMTVPEGAAFLGLVVAGLIVGGLAAAPLAGRVTKIVPARALMFAVGFVVIALAIWQAVRVLPALREHALLQNALNFLH